MESGRLHRGVVHDCYQEARRAYRRTRRVAARSGIDQEAKLLHTLCCSNISAFWRNVGRVRRGRQSVHCNLNAESFHEHFSHVHDDDEEQLSPSQVVISRAVAERFSEGCAGDDPKIVTGEMVSQLIPRIKRGSAPGPDFVTPEHLFFGNSPELLEALARLLTACFAVGRVPRSFSTSVVTPILKKSGLDPNKLDNYRPIALTSILSKLLELIVLSELEASFVPHDLQFGFVEHRGTSEASLLINETVQWHLRRRSPVFVANLDARKFFDRIWHDGLFWRLIDLLSARTWCLLRSWYKVLSGQVAFRGFLSREFKILRGTRQGAILSPTLANVFIRPLLVALDDSGRGAVLHGCHVPAVCYADDLCLISCNVNYLDDLLSIVDKFAANWRLKFTCSEPAKTKSHCMIFGNNMLAETPSWSLGDQQLRVVSETEHLGSVMSSSLQATQHVSQRMKRARGSLYGLTPAGMFSKKLAPSDKAFLWSTVVAPSLTYGASVSPLRPEEISELERFQARHLKAALGLPPMAHHTALFAALGVPSVQETLRAMALRGFLNALKSEHRLSRAMIRGMTVLATDPAQIDGSFLGLVFRLCNSDLGNLLSVATGHIDREFIRPQSESNGVIDSLRFLASRTDSTAGRLMRLIVMPSL